MTNGNHQNDQFENYQEFIVAEFSYIAQTAFQAHEDRARVSEFFLISFGTFLAALFSSQFSNGEPIIIYIIFSLLFLAVSFLGSLTVLELSRLRLAWLKSVGAMNKMKDHLVSISPDLDDCFEWRTDSIPEPFKIKSVGFLKALEVSVLSGCSTGVALSFIFLAFGSENVLWCPSLVLTVISSYLYFVVFYYSPLKNA